MTVKLITYKFLFDLKIDTHDYQNIILHCLTIKFVKFLFYTLLKYKCVQNLKNRVYYIFFLLEMLKL